MRIIDTSLATRGADAAARIGILERHAQAFVRHATTTKLANFARAEANRIRKRVDIDSWPYLLKIESTNVCNLRCRYCYDEHRPPAPGERPAGRMTLERFRTLIDELEPYLFKVNLYGFGEPLLFPETLDMVQYAASANIGVAVSSSLNVCDPDLPRRIVASGLEVLIFSCHGASAETYGKFMVGGNLDLALANVRSIVSERRRAGSRHPFIDWQYCLTGFNEHEIRSARARAAELGLDLVRFIEPYGPADAPPEWHSSLFPPRGRDDEDPPEGACSWLYRAAYINWDGGLLPCCRETRSLANDFGNVLDDGGFEAVWRGDTYRRSRALLAGDGNRERSQDLLCGRCPRSREKR